MADERIKNLATRVHVGERVQARVLRIDLEANKLSLGMKPSYFQDAAAEGGIRKKQKVAAAEVLLDDGGEEDDDLAGQARAMVCLLPQRGCCAGKMQGDSRPSLAARAVRNAQLIQAHIAG